MAKLNNIPPITFEEDFFEKWGTLWRGTDAGEGKTKLEDCFSRKQAMDFGKELDRAIAISVAELLGGIPIVEPINSESLLPPAPDCVEVGDTRIIGGVRPQNFDMVYRPDGARIAYDSKTLNDESSIKKNWQNMINDIAAEATTLHTRFRYALALFVVVVPEPALKETQKEGPIRTLERMNERNGVDEEAHKAESVALIVWNPDTGEISNTVPEASSSLRIEKYADRIETIYRARYKGLPPHMR